MRSIGEPYARRHAVQLAILLFAATTFAGCGKDRAASGDTFALTANSETENGDEPVFWGSETLIAVDADGAGDGSASSDGRFIAASSTRLLGQSAIWLFDRKISSWRQLTNPGNGDREPAISPDGRYVVFITDRNEQTDLWAIEIETGREFPLTNDSVAEEYPAWSKDGRRLVFTGGPWKERNFFTIDFASDSGAASSPKSVLREAGHVGACNFKSSDTLICHVYEETAGNILEVDLRTQEARKLTDGDWWFYKPDASPDGWVAVTVFGDQGETIRFFPDGGGGSPLPSPAIQGSWPQFVNDGRELIFHRQVDDGVGLKILNMNDGAAMDLSVEGRLSSFASLSPDGRRIAYCRNDVDKWSVRIRTLDTGEDIALPIQEQACNPSWSPDGDRIAINFRNGEHWALAVTRLDGSDLRILHEGTNKEWRLPAPAAWSPNGRHIAYAATTAPYESDLFVADLEDWSVRNITADAWYDEGPSWSADGDTIVFMSTRGGGWTWGLFAIPAVGGEARILVEPDYIERRFPQLDEDGTVWWIESDLCLGATYLVRRSPGEDPKKYFDFPGAAWFSRADDGRTAILPIAEKRIEYRSLSSTSDK